MSRANTAICPRMPSIRTVYGGIVFPRDAEMDDGCVVAFLCLRAMLTGISFLFRSYIDTDTDEVAWLMRCRMSARFDRMAR